MPFLIALGVLVAALLVLLGVASTRPGTFRVQRSARISAPADRIFGLLADFHRWTEWSPWEDVDPDLRRTFTGADSGPGAIYEWSGNRKAGQGRMEITTATPPAALEISLDFIKPIKAHNITEFTLTEQDGSTTVEWTMSGDNTLAGKVMGLFIPMDSLVGKDFEKGLARLKAATETP